MSCRDYLFGDQLVRTSLTLSELPVCDRPTAGRPIQVDIRADPDERSVAWLHDWRDESDQVTLVLARSGEHYLLRFPGLCDFSLDAANSHIAVHPRDDADPATLEHLLVDQVLPRYLAHEGRLAIHASAIATEAGTLLFLGRSGWGKSTLAGLLQSRGVRVLSDDCVLLAEDHGRVTALPTYESLRLFDDSIARAFPARPATTPVASYTDKRRIAAARRTGQAPGSAVIALYFLNDPADAVDDVTIGVQTEAASCIRMIRHAFQLDITDREASVRLLGQASAMARAIPAFELAYPRDFSRANAAADAILAHAASLHEPAGNAAP